VSLDRRLREGFDRASGEIHTDTEKGLGRVVAGARRKVRTRRIAVGTVLVAVAGAAIFTGPPLVEGIQGDSVPRPKLRPAVRPPSDPAQYERIAGSYRSDPIYAGGRTYYWTMRLGPDGILLLRGPHQFHRQRIIRYWVSGDQFRSDAFSNDICPTPLIPIGTYRWRLDGDALSFVPLEDRCSFRRGVFASRTWHREN
jgi:hypothetical protein